MWAFQGTSCVHVNRRYGWPVRCQIRSGSVHQYCYWHTEIMYNQQLKALMVDVMKPFHFLVSRIRGWSYVLSLTHIHTHRTDAAVTALLLADELFRVEKGVQSRVRTGAVVVLPLPPMRSIPVLSTCLSACLLVLEVTHTSLFRRLGTLDSEVDHCSNILQTSHLKILTRI